MGLILDSLTDLIYETFFEKEVDQNGVIKENTASKVVNNVANSVKDKVTEKVVNTTVEKVLPAVVNAINNNDNINDEITEYVTYEGDVSDYPSERLELDSNYPIIRLSETPDEDNIFGSSIFRFRTNGPRYGCDIRLEPFYKIPMKFYEDKWGEEIITFTDVLAGYIPLIEKARIVARDPDLYFGIRVYNNPDSFMLSSLDKRNKITDDVIITVDNNKYEVSWKKDLTPRSENNNLKTSK